MADTLTATVQELTDVLEQLKTEIQTLPTRLQDGQTVAGVLAAVDTDRRFFELVQTRARLLMDDLAKAKGRKKPKSSGVRAVGILRQASVDIRDIKVAEMLTEALQDDADRLARRADDLGDSVSGYVVRLPAD